MIPKTIYTLIAFICLVHVHHCLYEDQVSKWDFRHRFIGKLKYLASTDVSSSSQTVILATEKNVLASLHLKNGSINWRQVLEPNEFNLATGVSDGDESKEILTVNVNGLYVRGWDPLLGTLNFEQRLPESIVGDEDGNNQNFLFHAKSSSKELLVAKFDDSSRKLEVRAYSYKTKEVNEINTLSVGGWLKSIRNCKFINSEYLICVDVEQLSVSSLKLKPDGNFIPVSLTNFGLQTTEKPEYLKLVAFEKQPVPEEPFFAVDLGGDGFALLRLVSDAIKLVKILPKVKQLSIESVGLNESPAKYAVFLLIARPEAFKDDPSVKKDHSSENKQFKVALFDIETWEEDKSMMGQFSVRSTSAVLVDNMFILPIQQGSKYYYKILISTRDGSLFLSSSQGKISWRREEALSDIVAADIIDLPLSELDASIEQTFGFHSANIVNLFLNRVTHQIGQLQTYFTDVFINLMETVAQQSDTRKLTSDDDSIDLNGEATKGLVRDKFGLHKLIVAHTKFGKVFAIDTVTGKIVWHFFDEDLILSDEASVEDKLPIFVQRTTSYYPHPARCAVVTRQGTIVSFNPITGEIVDKTKLKKPVRQAMLLSHVDETHLKGILIVDEDSAVQVYPATSASIFAHFKDTYYLSIGNSATGVLEGFSFSPYTLENPVAERVWSLGLPLSEVSGQGRLQIHFKRSGEHVHSQGRVLGDRSVLYKYLNPNLMVVVYEGVDPTASEFGKRSNYVNLYLIDAVTGSVLYSVVNKRSKGPVFVVHSENSIVYSYYNEKSRRTEISSIELYEGKNQENATSFTSLFRLNLKPPIIEHQSYIFPTGILAMVDTITEKGITNKHLLIALPSGGILELPKAFVDPRRPITPTAEHREEGLIPYIPELPIPSEGIVNYNKSLLNIKNIVTASSSLESTCLVFAYGLDVFYTRVTPSKTFDILKDDFDHWLIAGVLLILIGFSYFTKWLAARKSLNNAWK